MLYDFLLLFLFDLNGDKRSLEDKTDIRDTTVIIVIGGLEGFSNGWTGTQI